MSQTTIIESFKKLLELSKNMEYSIVSQNNVLHALDPNFVGFTSEKIMDSDEHGKTNGLIDDLGILVDRITSKQVYLSEINATINNLIDPNFNASLIEKQ